MSKLKSGLDILKAVYNYTPEFLKGSTKGNKVTQKLEKKFGAKTLRRGKAGVASAIGLGSLLGDSGPDDEETTERAMNQLRFGVDMTDSEMEDAMAEGKKFTDTGIIGENGLNEEQVRAYIAQNADQRGTAEKIGGGVLDVLSFVPGYGQAVAAIGGSAYENKLKDARNLNLQNIVGKLKADANEGKIRKDMEGSLGKFMSEGLLPKDFGRGKVRGDSGGIKPASDAAAEEERRAAEKEYIAERDRVGVFAALTHPSAKKAGRVVFEDVQEASGGDKNTAEALLSGAGLTDDETTKKYYGDPEKNAASNRMLSLEAQVAAVRDAAKKAEAEKAASPSAQALAQSGPIEPPIATTAEQVRNNQELINTQKGYLGESPVAAQQRAYMEDRGVMTARGETKALNAAGNAMYQKAYGYAPGSADATADAWNRLYKNIDAGRKQYQANRAAAAEKEYDKYIVKPGDPDYKLGPQASKGPSEAAMDEYMKATELGGGPAQAPTVASQANASAATFDDVTGMYGFKPGELNANPTITPPRSPSQQAPGMPQLPDIGAPARRMGEAVGGAIFSQDGTGIPLPGGANLKAPRLPDIGAPARRAGEAVGDALFSQNGTGVPIPGGANLNVPQLPDIGAPARRAGEAVGNLLFSQNRPGVQLTDAQRGITPAPQTPAYDAKGNLNDPKIALMLAEQKRKEIEARNKANPQRSTATRPDPLRRFY